MNIWDVVFRHPFNLAEAISNLAGENINSIIYHFPPDVLQFEYDNTEVSDTLLFVKGNLDISKGYFKFPVTAQT